MNIDINKKLELEFHYCFYMFNKLKHSYFSDPIMYCFRLDFKPSVLNGMFQFFNWRLLLTILVNCAFENILFVSFAAGVLGLSVGQLKTNTTFDLNHCDAGV